MATRNSTSIRLKDIKPQEIGTIPPDKRETLESLLSGPHDILCKARVALRNGHADAGRLVGVLRGFLIEAVSDIDALVLQPVAQNKVSAA